MNKRFSNVAGFSDRIRIPLVGKIRLGIKVKKDLTPKCKHSNEESCLYCTYPKEVTHFVVPPEVAKVYTEEPTRLDVFLLSDIPEDNFPCSCRRYGSTKGLKCTGDKTVAYDIEKKQDVECPCPHYIDDVNGEKAGQIVTINGETFVKDCREVGFLFVMLPKVSLGGVYQIRTTSGNSVTDVKSGMLYVKDLFRGSYKMKPLILWREKTETHHDQKKQIHYTMKLSFGGNLEEANRLIANDRRLYEPGRIVALPAPKDENPETEPADIIEQNGIIDEEDDASRPKNPQNPTNAAGDQLPLTEQKPQIEKLPEGVHPKVVADKIKALLKQSGFLKKKNPEGKYYELVLIQHANEKAKKYGDLNRQEIESLYYELAEAQGNPDTITIPFE